MSKFWCLGMNLNDIVRATTETPAAALRRPELGSLKPGTPGDATVVKIVNGPVVHIDALGEKIEGDRQLACTGIVIDGKWWNEGPKI